MQDWLVMRKVSSIFFKLNMKYLDAAPAIRCQTRPSFPYTNPSGVWAAGTQPDNLVIHWNPMDKYYWNAPHLNYLIRYEDTLI